MVYTSHAANPFKYRLKCTADIWDMSRFMFLLNM